MSVTTMDSFAQSTGKSANKKAGEFAGRLLGKIANGLDALDAMLAVAEGNTNKFMELAKEATHVLVQKLDAIGTMAFASPDNEFNGSLTQSFSRAYSNQRQKAPPAAQRTMAKEVSAPSLGLGSKPSRRRKEVKEE